MRIRTRFLPATDTLGARIRATDTSTRAQLTLPYDHASADAHRAVATQLAGRPVWYSGERHPVRGYYFMTDD